MLDALVAAPFGTIGKAERFLRDVRLRKPARRRSARAGSAGEGLPLPHAFAAPIRVEDFVEALPIRMRGAEQCAQGRFQRRGPECGWRCEYSERITCFCKADAEAVRAQCARKTGEPAAHGCGQGFFSLVPAKAGTQRWIPAFAGVRGKMGVSSHHATLPSNRSLTSRVSRARSSWVLSKHIMVSKTASGSCRKSWTSRPASVAAQSSVSATPGTLRKSSLRTAATMREIGRAHV